LPSFAKCLEQN